MRIIPFLLVAVLVLNSCVTKKAHNALQSEFDTLKKEASLTSQENKDNLKANEELSAKVIELEKENKLLKSNEKQIGRKMQFLEDEIISLKESNLILENNYNDLLSSSSSRNQKLFKQLGEKERLLKLKEDSLNARTIRIESLEADLAAREARVKELEKLMAQQDSAVQALKNKIKDALYNFSADEVSIEVKNGKVYISLSNEILFKSGSTTVDPKGVEAMDLLAKILNANEDIEVNIEGHTDTDKGVDNWDLSVKRATSIVRILTNDNNKVDPKRVTASGRSEFQPKASNDSAEGKAQNRRIEVILTPNLDEIYDFLGEL